MDNYVEKSLESCIFGYKVEGKQDIFRCLLVCDDHSTARWFAHEFAKRVQPQTMLPLYMLSGLELDKTGTTSSIPWDRKVVVLIEHFAAIPARHQRMYAQLVNSDSIQSELCSGSTLLLQVTASEQSTIDRWITDRMIVCNLCC